MFKLGIDSADTHINSPSVPVRWCLDKDFFNSLRLDEGEELFVLIVYRGISDGSDKREGRRIIPAQSLEHYFVFDKPGEYVVAGLLLKKSYVPMLGSKTITPRGQLEDLYFKTEYNGTKWAAEVMNYDAELMEGLPYTVCPGSKLTVSIPTDCFAPEPPQWEQKWVNFLYAQPPVDQCAYRRRRILAYSFQLPLLMLKVVVSMPLRVLAVLLTLLLGWWEVDWSCLIHPFSKSFMDIWAPLYTQDNFYRSGFKWVKKKFFRRKPKLQSYEERSLLSEQASKRRLSSYRALSCELEGERATALVPFSSKVYLLYNQTKRKVCKPFAR